MYTVLLIILAFIIPPLAVFMKSGLNANFFLNIVMYFSGIFLAVYFDFPYGALVTACHAVWIILLTD